MVLLAVDGVVLPRAVKYPVLMNCRQAPSKGETLHCVVSYLAVAKFALLCQLPCYSEMWLCVVRYPVVLKCFHLNPGTGGVGAFNGGDGVVREFLFRKPLTLSILTERRVFAPYGLQGRAQRLG